MRHIFADTVFLFPKINPQDMRHRTALATEAALGDTKLVATDIVFAELLALARYESRADSAYSLVDCISMEVMDDFDITEVLTADHDFELEGYTRLMRNPRELRGA